MNAKEFFARTLIAQLELDTIRMQRERLEVLMDPATAKLKEVPIHGSGEALSKAEQYVVGLERLDERYGQRAQELAAMLEEADSIIQAIPKPRHKQVLQLRYMCGMRWEAIREAMEYQDVRSVFKLHGWALAEADRVMRNRALIASSDV